MSEPASAGTDPEVVELPASGDAAFASLMDVLAPEQDAPAAEAAAEAAGAPAAGAGSAAPAGEGTGAAAAAAGTPAAGDAGKPGVPAAGEAAAGTGAAAADAGQGTPGPGAGTVDAAALAPKWGEISTAIEQNTIQIHQEAALTEVRTEYPKYFEALEKHPRLLVGQKVPSLTGGPDDMDTLHDSSDAKEWQEAVKAVLVAEVKDRAVRKAEDSESTLEVLHSSIELFQNNQDLIPGTRQFDRDLANRFAEFAKPYELRVDGKLRGYSIPVQPLITQLRAQVIADRKAAQAPPAAPAAAAAAAPAAAAGTPAAPAAAVAPAAAGAADGPQAGITSKAGAGTTEEDFSVLFGTIGLPNLRI